MSGQIYWNELPAHIARVDQVEVLGVGGISPQEPIIVPQVPNLNKGNGRKH